MFINNGSLLRTTEDHKRSVTPPQVLRFFHVSLGVGFGIRYQSIQWLYRLKGDFNWF